VAATLASPAPGAPLPCFLLDRFSAHARADPATLVSLAPDTLATKPRVLGWAVDPRAAARDGTAACGSARVRVALGAVRDVVHDLSEPPAVWLVTSRGWWRLLRPAPEYSALFAPLLSSLDLAAAAADAAAAALGGSGGGGGVDGVVARAQARADARAEATAAAASPDADLDPYALPAEPGAEPLVSTPMADVAAGCARALAAAAAAATGRGAPAPNPTLDALAAAAGITPAALRSSAPPIRSRRALSAAPPADAGARPPPTCALSRPAPGAPLAPLLAAWDLVHAYAPGTAPAGSKPAASLPSAGPPMPLDAWLACFRDAPPPSSAWTLASAHAALLEAAVDPPPGSGDAKKDAAAAAAAAPVPRGATGALLVAAWPHLVCHALLPTRVATLKKEREGSRDGGGSKDGKRAASPGLPAGAPAKTAAGGRVRAPMAPEAEAALRRLAAAPYASLPADTRCAILRAVLDAATDGARLAAAASARADAGPRRARGLLGADGAGVRFHALAGAAGAGLIFAEASEDAWSVYEGKDAKALVAWLASGDDGEAGAAAAAAAHLARARHRAPALPDPCASMPSVVDHRAVRAPLADMLGRARWWEKHPLWLQARAAARSFLSSARTPLALARAAWLVEELTYDDLLKGAGWGRKRAGFRERLQRCASVSEAAALVASMVGHCRTLPDLGRFETRDEFDAVLHAAGGPAPPELPTVGARVVVSATGYAAHAAAARPPAGFEPRPLPAGWGALVDGTVAEVALAAGAWHRPTWQGRFTSANAVTAPDAHLRVVAWLLVRRGGAPGPAAVAADGAGDRGDASDAGAASAVDWTGHTFLHGFHPPDYVPAGMVAAPPPAPAGAGGGGGGGAAKKAVGGYLTGSAIHLGDELADPEGEFPFVPFWPAGSVPDLAAVGVHCVGGEHPAPRFVLPHALAAPALARAFAPGDRVAGAGVDPSPGAPGPGATGVVVGARAAGAGGDPWRSVTVAWDDAPRGGGATRRHASPWELR